MPPTTAPTLILGTRKGLIVMARGASGWRLVSEALPGVPVPYAVVDPRDGTLWVSEDHGHWGPKLSRSADGGRTVEAVPTPAYPEGALCKEEEAASNKFMWVIEPGPADRPALHRHRPRRALPKR
jgi:hypothetical protein